MHELGSEAKGRMAVRGSCFVLAAACALAMIATPARAAARDTLTVVTLNIWHDQRDWPKRLARIVAEMRALRPDVLCLQEVLQHETLPNQAATIGESLGFHVHFTSVDSVTRTKRYGNAILTPHRVVGEGGRNLEPMNDYRTVAHLRVEVRGRTIDVYDTHLHHTPEGGAIREKQLRDLLAFVDSTRGPGPLVLAGDFNATRESPEMALLTPGYLDAWTVTHPGERGPAPTTMNPRFDPTPHHIDHVYVARRPPRTLQPLACEILFRETGPDSVWASDHYGVLAKLALPPAGPARAPGGRRGR